MDAVIIREQARAVAVAEFLAPEIGAATGGGDGSEPAATSAVAGVDSGFVEAPVTPRVSAPATPADLVPSTPTAPGSPPPSSGAPPAWPTGRARVTYNGQTVALGGNGYTLTNGQTDAPAVPLLEALASSFSLGQSAIEINGGSTFASSDTTSVVGLEASRLSAASLLSLSGAARFSLSGSLYVDRDGALDLSADALRLTEGARLQGSGSEPLVDLAGTTARSTGSLLSASGGALVELLSASAPLLRLSRSAVLTTERSLVDLSGDASVRLGQLVALTASSLSVRGHALSLSGSARLGVTGDLFRLAGGSTLTVTNGALLSLTGRSSLTVAGALVNFVGSGNTLSVSNNLCGGACTMVGNLPVLVTGGGSITLANPILNLIGNTLAIAPGSAVITVTGGAQVKQGP
jgi:hypothetical protein